MFFKIRSHLPLRGKLGWMTPRVGVKTTLTIERATPGLLFPSKGPTFLPNAFSGWNAASAPRQRGSSLRLIHFSRYCNIQLMQHVLYFRLPQARRIVLERQAIFVLNPEAPQTIGVGKRSERAQLFFR